MWVVTGSNGLIGRQLVTRVKGVKFLTVDLTNANLKPQQLFRKKDLSEIEGIIHLGAITNTREQDMRKLRRVNVEWSKKLFKLAEKLDIPFIYASSCAVYGDGSKGWSEDAEGLEPLSKYGQSKLEFDLWALKQPFKKWWGLRFSNVFGPNEEHKGDMGSLVYRGYHDIKHDGKVTLLDFKGKEAKRDFVYVKDVIINLNYLINDFCKLPGGLYNICSGQPMSWEALANMMFTAMGKPVNATFVDAEERVDLKTYQLVTEPSNKKWLNFVSFLRSPPLKYAVKDCIEEMSKDG